MAQRYQQPQSGPFRLASSSPLTRGLSILALPGGALALDAAGGIASQSVIGALSTGPVRGGVGLLFNGSSQLAVSSKQSLSIASGFTVVIAFSVIDSGSKGSLFTLVSLTGGSMQFARSTSNGLQVDAQQAIGIFGTSALGITAGTTNVAALSWVGTSYTAALNGVIVASGSSSQFSGASTDLRIAGRNGDTSEALNGAITCFAVYSRACANAELTALTGNPWQLFAPTQRLSFAPAATGGGAALAASNSASTSASASLSTAIKLSAVASATTGGSAALTTQVALIASNAAGTAGTAALSSNIALQASNTASSNGSANLLTAISLTATASATTGGSASLSTAISLAASSAATTGASAALATQIAMQAIAAASTSSSATLTASGQGLQASNGAVTGGSASLSTLIQLAGQGAAVTSSAASLSTAIQLAASNAASTSANSVLTANGAVWSASNAAVTMATANLSTQIRLTASNQTQTSSSADLSIGTLSKDPRYIVSADTRLFAIAQAVRPFTVAISQRPFKVTET